MQKEGLATKTKLRTEDTHCAPPPSMQSPHATCFHSVLSVAETKYAEEGGVLFTRTLSRSFNFKSFVDDCGERERKKEN